MPSRVVGSRPGVTVLGSDQSPRHDTRAVLIGLFGAAIGALATLLASGLADRGEDERLRASQQQEVARELRERPEEVYVTFTSSVQEIEQAMVNTLVALDIAAESTTPPETRTAILDRETAALGPACDAASLVVAKLRLLAPADTAEAAQRVLQVCTRAHGQLLMHELRVQDESAADARARRVQARDGLAAAWSQLPEAATRYLDLAQRDLGTS